ncbi:class I SAM-dependent methyltransferase [Methylomicrobium lacus]|uniref:class I SAM-dependent methyltransferase n=1 Tax=Methylomicrobium lacus TaxID=136992 RepID=UPI0035A877C6
MDVKEDQILGASVNTHWYYVSKSKAIQMLLRSLSEGNVLDVGAGSGVFSKLLLETDLAASARCVDTAYPFDEKSEIHHNKTISFVKSVENIDETVILMIDVLEHIEDDHAFLKHYVDRIPDGSYVLMSVPAFRFLWSGHDIFLEHKRRYTLSELETLAKNSGLKVIRGRYFFGLLFPLIALIRLINRLLLKTGKLSAKSDLKRSPGFINQLLINVHNFELKTLFHLNRMAGLTAFCLAQK